MLLRLHLPSSLDMPGASAQQQIRLRQVIAQSFERAVAALNLPSVQIELVQAGTQANSDQGELVQTSIQAYPDRREPVWQKTQANSDQGELVWQKTQANTDQIELVQAGIQTDSDRHEPVWQKTQATSDQGEPVEAESRDSAEDIHHVGLPAATVYREEGGTYIYSGECHYREAKSFALAIEQGTTLFAHSGYAVLQARTTERFSVLQLNAEEQASFDGRADLSVHPGERVHLVKMAGEAPQEHTVIAVVDGNGQTFFKNREDQAAIPSTARGATPRERGGTLDFIVMMDRSLFAEMPWEKRIEYLLLLLNAWAGEREEHALLELMISTRTGAELAAFFALLCLHGKHWQLFQDLNERNYRLLQLLAECVDDEPPDWHSLVSLLLDMKMLSDTPLPRRQDPSHELQEPAGRLSAWLHETLTASDMPLSPQHFFKDTARHQMVVSAFSATDNASGQAEAVIRSLLWLVNLAHQGDQQTQKLVTRMLMQASAGSMEALSGLRAVEELTRPASMERDDPRSKERGFGKRLREQLRALLIFNLLVWLTEHDVIIPTHLIVEGLPQRLAALVDGSSAWLPESDSAGMGPDYSKRLQRCIIAAGGITAQATQGLRALLQCRTWDQAAVLDLIEQIAPQRLQAFLRTIPFVSPLSLERLDTRTLKELAGHPAALSFIREAGYDLLHGTLTRLGGSWEALDRFLHKLTRKREAIGNALGYRWFLYRMEKGEEAAFAEVDAVELHEDRSSSTEGSAGTR